jgi:putative addiction module component (TIGR02574 family)
VPGLMMGWMLLTLEWNRMSIEAQQILESGLTLPAIDRAAIVESLLSSLDHPDAQIDAVWAEGAEKRIAAYDAGQMQAVPVEEGLQAV